MTSLQGKQFYTVLCTRACDMPFINSKLPNVYISPISGHPNTMTAFPLTINNFTGEFKHCL